MAVTLIYDDRASHLASAGEHDADLWLSPEDLTASTGWEYKPQGMCLGDRCVPIPPACKDAFVRAGGAVNLSAFARHIEQPVVHDAASGVWLFGESAAVRTDALRSLDAPDFTLPDLDGVAHSLSDYRGKKILLLAWASW